MKTNDIEYQFNKVAEQYDLNRKKFIPCFDDFYNYTTNFVASNIAYPNTIVDLGAGTGLLSQFWYSKFPKSKFILVDIAKDMLSIAKERFANLSNVSYQICDYSKSLPKESCDVIISALSIHHLQDQDKIKLFKNIFDKLPNNGIFANYDQFCAGSDILNNWFDAYWENGLQNSGLTPLDIDLWKERRKLDKECSVESQIKMLKDSGFREVNCVYSYGKFSVILAIK